MKLAIVLGGSKGLGTELCQQYLQQGWHVQEFSRSAPHHFSQVCDLARISEAEKILDQAFANWAKQTWSEVHLVHNAARLGQILPFHKTQLSDNLQSIMLNFTSLVMAAQVFTQHFVNYPAAKCLIAISSGAAQKDYAGWSMYCATKAAMERFMGVLSVEQSSQVHPIHALVINPGVMDTAMQAQIRKAKVHDFPHLERFLKLKNDDALPLPSVVAEIIMKHLLMKNPENGLNFRVADFLS